MDYLTLCKLYDVLESTSRRLEKTLHIAKYLKDISTEDSSDILLLLEGKIFPDSTEQKIGVSDSIVIKAIKISTGSNQVKIDSLWKNTGDLGLVAQELVQNKSQETLFRQDITIKKVAYNLKKIASLEGQGTVDQKVKLISELLTSANPIEAKYIVRTILESLRIGVSSGTIRDAIVWSYIFDLNKIPKQDYDEIFSFLSSDENKEKRNDLTEKIDYAYSIVNDYGVVIKILREKGKDALKSLEPVVGSPLKAMLVQKVKNVTEAFNQVGSPAAFEYKYDGFRIQVHKDKDNIKIFTRSLDDVTIQFPEIVEYAKTNINCDKIILDGEAVGFDTVTKDYLPFQKISQRIKRKYDIEEMMSHISVEWTIFDVLFKDSSTLFLPFLERRKIIESVVKIEEKKVVLSKILITDNVDEAEKFYQKALFDKLEGVVVKNLNANYIPGSRVGTQVKLKPIMDPLDLVIVGAEWGEGKRANWFTSFVLACKDGDNFLEIGKVGTGFKEINGENISEDGLVTSSIDGSVSFDELTKLLINDILKEIGKEVKIKPKVVLEIAFEEIQKSQSYSSGFALRFPRVLRLRPEKPIDEISSIEDVKKYYYEQ